MTKAEFEKVLEQKALAWTETQAIDWDAQKRYWLEMLENFYSTVEGYLEQFKAPGKIKLGRVKVSLTEEHIGEYEADSMEVFLGSDKVTLMPIGTLLLGAKGRVDMTGPAGVVKFILTEKGSNRVRGSFAFSGVNPSARETHPHPVMPEALVWKIATPPPSSLY